MASVLECILHERLSIRLRHREFTPILSGIFRRVTHETGNLISIPIRFENKVAKFTCNLGLQFEALEQLIHGKFHVTAVTVMCPLHLLFSSREYYEWEFSGESQVDEAVDLFMQDFIEVGEPYFLKYQELEAVRRELIENDKSEPWVLASHQRTAILAACEVIYGRRDLAEAIIQDALSDPKNQPHARRFRLEQLRKQILRM